MKGKDKENQAYFEGPHSWITCTLTDHVSLPWGTLEFCGTSMEREGVEDKTIIFQSLLKEKESINIPWE